MAIPTMPIFKVEDIKMFSGGFELGINRDNSNNGNFYGRRV